MSISVSRIAVIPLLETIRVLREESDIMEFALGLEPIIKLAAWETTTLEVDFVSAAPDLVVIRRAVRRILYVRLNGFCVNLRSLISLALRCHSGDLSFRD